MRIRTFIPREDDFLESEDTSGSALHEGAIFLLTSLIIVFFGLVVLYSTSFVTTGTGFFAKQLIWTAIGAVGFSAAVILGYQRLCQWSWMLLIVISVLLVLTLFSKPINGARRWLKIGEFSIQSSEYAKVVLVLFLSYFLANRIRILESVSWKNHLFRVFIPACLFCGIMIGLVLLGKDLGTTALLSMVFLILLGVAGIKWYFIMVPILLGTPAVFFAVKFFSPVRWARITSFTKPEMYQSTDGYQLWLSQLALGSGEWFGLGFTESRLKLKYLPEAHTDFILAIVGEELGYVILLAVIAAYLILMFSGIRISRKARTQQGMLVAFGMITFITLQAIINMGVICGAFPTKGMPAPMISYGGSNLVACMTAVGCVFSVALDTAYPNYSQDLFVRIRQFLRSRLLPKHTENPDELR